VKKYRLIAGLPLNVYLCIWCESPFETDTLPHKCPGCERTLTFDLVGKGLPPVVARMYATALEDIMKEMDAKTLDLLHGFRMSSEVEMGVDWRRT